MTKALIYDNISYKLKLLLGVIKIKFKRIFFITIFVFMALSITAFAELPSTEESEKFAKLFTLVERTDATEEEE